MKKIKKQYIVIFFILCIILLLYLFKDYSRTPSKDRIEKTSDINIPIAFKVLEDEQEGMGQDYCIKYTIQFDKNVTPELIKSIQSSKFYDINCNGDEIIDTTSDYPNEIIDLEKIDGKIKWCKYKKGYTFINGQNVVGYDLYIDTTTNILQYTECNM